MAVEASSRAAWGTYQTHKNVRRTSQITDSVQTDSEAIERRKSSITALEQIYYVIVGLAVTNAISVGIGKLNGTLDAKASTSPPHSTIVAASLFLVFVSTVIRFVQGTATHFGSHKAEGSLLNRGQFAAWQPLIDFFGFGAQASLFVVLASELERPDWFIRGLLCLLAFDLSWILTTLRFDQEAKTTLFRGVLTHWSTSNIIFGIFVTSVWYYTTQEMYIKAIEIGIASLVACLVDYWYNQEFYLGVKRKIP